MHFKGCSRLEILNWLLLLSPRMPGSGEGWDDIKAMSSAATVLLLRVHTEINRGAKEKRKKKCPSHGILKNAKSWGNRQIICGIVIKLNDPSPPPYSLCLLLSKLQRVAESHSPFYYPPLWHLQMFGNCGKERKSRRRDRWGETL